jgi:hypothetical protein
MSECNQSKIIIMPDFIEYLLTFSDTKSDGRCAMCYEFCLEKGWEYMCVCKEYEQASQETERTFLVNEQSSPKKRKRQTTSKAESSKSSKKRAQNMTECLSFTIDTAPRANVLDGAA